MTEVNKNLPKLKENMITFGKYKDLELEQMLRDRKYCAWLLEQDWFIKNYNYLYNRVKEHNPKHYFIAEDKVLSETCSIEEFLNNYSYFNLYSLENIKIQLTEVEKKCYEFYLQTIQNLKNKIIDNMEKGLNPYDIKAPTSWLKKFEQDYNISRDILKEFLNAYDLPNIPYIIEKIKSLGGIEYKGAKSFLIAKQNSLNQEKYWEDILKKYYGQDIGTQYKFKNCFFDFILIKTNTLYECKLGIKDFNEEQYKKYLATLGNFSMVYLIGQDCIIDLKKETIFTTRPEYYQKYFSSLTTPSKFDLLVQNFCIIELSDISEYFA